jgi:hypothetical protein
MARKTSKQVSSKATEGGKPRQRGINPPATKQAMIVGLLKRREGAGITDLMAATGWQAHSVRAALTGLRKRELAIVRTKADGGGSVYRIRGATRS